MRRKFNLLGKTITFSGDIIENKTMQYSYTQVSNNGYRWNMSQRIQNEIGTKPTMTGDTPDGSGGMKTVVEFSRELIPEEKTILDLIMASDPVVPPPTTCRVKIGDMWNKLAQFNASSGADFKLYYSQSVPGSGNVDTIELHTATPLTAQQKNKIQTAYANLLNIL